MACHQECATVPANPFPEPINGKAVAMWKHVKDFAVPAASNSTDNATKHGDGGGNGSGDGRSSPAMAGIAQAALAAAAASSRKTKKPRPQAPPSGSGADNRPPLCGKSDGGCGGGGRGPREERGISASSGELESSEPIMLGDTQGGNGSGDGDGSSSKGMRQESYYLRGAVEEARDRDLLAAIADCIPGDVAFGAVVLNIATF